MDLGLSNSLRVHRWVPGELGDKVWGELTKGGGGS